MGSKNKLKKNLHLLGFLHMPYDIIFDSFGPSIITLHFYADFLRGDFVFFLLSFLGVFPGESFSANTFYNGDPPPTLAM